MDFRLFFSIVATIISVLSLYFSRRSWSESNRPMITVKVSKHSSGNNATTLNLVVENTGSRPAKNIELSVKDSELNSALHQDIRCNDRQIIESCFADDTVIPVLANGKCAKNNFGQIYHHQDNTSLAAKLSSNSSKSTWNKFSRFEITVNYQDLDGRKYKDCIPILIADNDEGFAGCAWNKPR